MTRSGEVGRGEEGKSRGTERGASLGMPFRVSRQVAISSKRRPSEPAGVKRNHTDLHIMIYILVLCLSSTLSPLVSTASDRRPLFSRVPQHPAASPRSSSSSLFFPFVSLEHPLPSRVYPLFSNLLYQLRKMPLYRRFGFAKSLLLPFSPFSLS